MTLTADDIIAIHQLVALHGHLVDGRELHRLDELFTPDVVYDVTAMGQGVVRGIDEFRALSESFADDARNPIGHHVTNIVVTEGADGGATVRSKGIGVLRDGRTGSVVYDDRVSRTPHGWRITARQVSRAGR
ncbi:nuclear transport factor 2 family protein [Pseudonocardia adelaidensis]|uniref:SnoaL-like domain-containing protein n=1 Tax=Pseudonocardia adelaidensis TaxID=648754 RepID=A0ABP9N8D7_9PSEU